MIGSKQISFDTPKGGEPERFLDFMPFNGASYSSNGGGRLESIIPFPIDKDRPIYLTRYWACYLTTMDGPIIHASSTDIYIGYDADPTWWQILFPVLTNGRIIRQSIPSGSFLSLNIGLTVSAIQVRYLGSTCVRVGFKYED